MFIQYSPSPQTKLVLVIYNVQDWGNWFSILFGPWLWTKGDSPQAGQVCGFFYSRDSARHCVRVWGGLGQQKPPVRRNKLYWFFKFFPLLMNAIDFYIKEKNLFVVQRVHLLASFVFCRVVPALATWLSRLEQCPSIYQKVVVWSLVRGIWEAASWCFSHTLMSLSLSLSLLYKSIF